VTGRPPDSREGRLPDQESSPLESVSPTTATDLVSVAQATVKMPLAGCTWCSASIPAHELACEACRNDVVAQLRRRREAELRLQPLADLARRSA
jgi:predicted nucleic acid-binding Zn ribbon protein